MVKAMNIALSDGFEVIYGDSLFIKREHASKEDYENLANSKTRALI